MELMNLDNPVGIVVNYAPAWTPELYWWFFAIAGFGTLAITLLTVGIQALKAVLANPVKALVTTVG